MKRIAIVGIGLLGSAVASRLLEAGADVAGYDVRPEQAEALRPRGLEPAGSLAEAVAGREMVFTILPTPDVVDSAIRGTDGVLAHAAPGTVIAQMSTISPGLTRSLAAAAADRRLGFVDAPMSGTSAMVARGDGTVFAGGAPAVVEACRPIFDVIARKTLHVGDVGEAMLAKLTTNLLVGLNTAAVAEALVLGIKGGLAPDRLLAIWNESAATSRMLEVRGPMMASHRFDAQMKAELLVKDFALMLDEGRRLAVALPMTSLAQQLTLATIVRAPGGDREVTRRPRRKGRGPPPHRVGHRHRPGLARTAYSSAPGGFTGRPGSPRAKGGSP
jgi:3-hydroxyisobutyrate dehydrogenase-like beta-hydroxyacid dehydrogenase